MPYPDLPLTGTCGAGPAAPQQTVSTARPRCPARDRREPDMKSTNPDDYQRSERPLAGMPKDFADGWHIAPHSHPRAQLAWAASGVMSVTAGADSWIVPPQRAVWIPAGTEHEIRMSGPVAMRSLYI